MRRNLTPDQDHGLVNCMYEDWLQIPGEDKDWRRSSLLVTLRCVPSVRCLEKPVPSWGARVQGLGVGFTRSRLHTSDPSAPPLITCASE